MCIIYILNLYFYQDRRVIVFLLIAAVVVAVCAVLASNWHRYDHVFLFDNYVITIRSHKITFMISMALDAIFSGEPLTYLSV